MSSVCARPSSTISLTSSPAIGPCMKPWPEKPLTTTNPSGSATRPMIGWASGVTSYSPAQCARRPARASSGSRATAASR